MIPLPYQIERNLFLGSRSFSQKSLSMMQISHVVMHKDSMYQKLPDVSYLECDVLDEEAADMSKFFKGASEFINNALQQGSRVLVLVHGRTRSAQLIAAHLVSFI
jgi:protein-tyrosine phosphatase